MGSSELSLGLNLEGQMQKESRQELPQQLASAQKPKRIGKQEGGTVNRKRG